MEQLSVQVQTFAESQAAKRCNWRLAVAVFIASEFAMVMGGIAGYLSPALPDLNEHRNPFHMTDDQQSWTGSLLALGSVFGGLASGSTCDLLGRKVAMMVSALLVIVGLTVVAASVDFRYMYAGMSIVAFFGTVNLSAATIYTSEVTPAEIRGTCMSLTTLAYSIGIVVIYAMGIPLPWNWLAIFLAAFIAAPNLVLAFLPESPYWFLMQGKREAAIHGVRWFQGACDMDEIAAVEQSLQQVAATAGSKASNSSPWRDLVVDGQNMKSLCVVSLLFIFQGFSGNIVLQMFTVSIFQLAGVSSIDPNVQAIIVGVCGVIGSLICPSLVDRIGRRMMMLVSVVVITVSMAAAGAFFLVLETKPEYAVEHLFWLPVVALSASNFGYMLGLFPVPYILSCEMLPTNVRGSAQTVFMVIQGLAFFGCIKTYIYIQLAISTSGSFFVYTGICAAGTLFVVFVVTEQDPSTMR